MSALVVRMNVSGFETIDAILDRLSRPQGETLIESLARLMREQIKNRIEAGGPSPDGAAWKANIEGRKPMLYRSGALARSIDYAVSGNQAVVGSGLIYAAIHQYGGTILPKKGDRLAFRIGNRQVFARKVTMPARPFVGLSGEDRGELVRAAVLYLRSLIG